MRTKEKEVIEFIIVKVEVEGEDEYFVKDGIQTYTKFVREYSKNVFLVGGKVCIEGDDILWIIKEIVYNEEFDINIIYVINRCTQLNIHENRTTPVSNNRLEDQFWRSTKNWTS